MRPRLAVKRAWKCRCVSLFLATDWFPISASMVHGRIGGCYGTVSQLQQALCPRKLSASGWMSQIRDIHPDGASTRCCDRVCTSVLPPLRCPSGIAPSTVFLFGISMPDRDAPSNIIARKSARRLASVSQASPTANRCNSGSLL